MNPIWSTAIAAAILTSSVAAGPFDAPLRTVRSPLQRDPDNPQARPKLTCAYFPGFMVKQVDLGEEGAAQLSILPTPAAACRRANAPGEMVISPTDWTGYFDGVRGGYVLFTAEDGWNGGMGFAVFDAGTGHKVFEDAVKTQFRSLEASPGGLILHYRRTYAAKCSLNTDPSGCWRAIQRDTGLTGASPPDCAAAYAKEARRTPKQAPQVRTDPTVVDYEVVATIQNSHGAIRTAPGAAPTCRPAD
ncbi:MAG TPA: hypothetical protein VHY32_01130 [Caulobacteraceae bacterium]|nr:hypothetical protein [Caulobacteraceae bacterium]